MVQTAWKARVMDGVLCVGDLVTVCVHCCIMFQIKTTLSPHSVMDGVLYVGDQVTVCVYIVVSYFRLRRLCLHTV